MTSLRLRRAFTLIEAMVVVVIIGVLAVLAIVAYRKWVQSSRMAEANDMLANIRTAEESFRAENGGYLSVSKSLGPGDLYPAATPGAFKTAWGGACGTCVASWSSLAVQPAGALYFGYAVVADNGGNAPGNLVSVNGATVNLASMAGQPWYVATAVGDLDGNGSPYTQMYALSSTNQIMVSNEGN